MLLHAATLLHHHASFIPTFVLSDAPRRDGPVGLIDGIQILIVPVVQGLRVSHQHRAGQDDAGEKFGILFPRGLAWVTLLAYGERN